MKLYVLEVNFLNNSMGGAINDCLKKKNKMCEFNLQMQSNSNLLNLHANCLK